LKIAIPPMFPDYPIQTYCVAADDMVYLTELYDLTLADGRLPRPNTNEIVLPWTVAKNRKIKVGDVIGSRDHPIYQDAPTLPVELVVSGIFAPSRVPQDETWFSFMSREFVEPLHISELSYIVAPRAGQKETLDAWLQSDISGPDNFIYTLRAQRSLTHKEMRTMLFTFALMEILIGVTGVLVILGLVYTFLAGRRDELGTLNALGFTRRELARRVMRENALSAGVAWLIGMLACFCALLYLQQGVYDSIGLRLDFLNPVSWLCTLPLPLAALMVSVITAGRVLSGVDPLAIIERR
jgi:hypothetical protein